MKLFIVAVLVFTGVNFVIPNEKASACYPAYKCMTTAPADYTLVYQQKDRRPGMLIGGVVVSTVGFGGAAAGVTALVGGTAVAAKELYNSTLSFKTYIKKSDKSGYKFKVKTIYYEKINFQGKQTIAYSYSN